MYFESLQKLLKPQIDPNLMKWMLIFVTILFSIILVSAIPECGKCSFFDDQCDEGYYCSG
jgi:hypothetical protein